MITKNYLDKIEKLLSLPAAVEEATGQRPHPSTLHRWRILGIKGVKLVTLRCGGRRLCSVESVRRFLDGVTEATDGPQPSTQARTSRQRQAAIDRAEAELDRAGI